MNNINRENNLNLKPWQKLKCKEHSNPKVFNSTILHWIADRQVFFAFLLLMNLLITSCNEKGKDILSKDDRTIVGGLYFGMPKDSVKYFLERSIYEAPFTITDCWEVKEQDVEKYYYINSFDFVEYQVRGSTGHFGLVFPKFKNGKLNECSIAIVNYSLRGNYAIAKQFASGDFLQQIPFLLGKSYGKDSISYGVECSTMVVGDNGNKTKSIGATVHNYSPKFGSVQFVQGVKANDIIWRNSTGAYLCYAGPEDSNPDNVDEWVYSFPCIHYKLDPKYEEQLGMTSEKPL